MSTTFFIWLLLLSLAAGGGIFVRRRKEQRKLTRQKIQEALAQNKNTVVPKAAVKSTTHTAVDEVIIAHREYTDASGTKFATDQITVVQSTPEEDSFAAPAQESAKEAGKNDLKAFLNRAEILLARNDFQEAEKLFIKILAFEPDHPVALQKLAYLYLQTEFYPKAETLYRQLLEISPKNPAVYTNLGLALFQQKKFAEAIEAYETAIEFDPERGARYANLGQVFFVIKDLEAALACFRTAVEKDPRNLNFLYLLADTLLEAKHFVEAKKAYERILDLSPYDEAAKEEVRRLQALGF